jgi:hypothetical protein
MIGGVPVIPDQQHGADKRKGKRHGDAAIAYVNLVAASHAEAWEAGYTPVNTHGRDRYIGEAGGGLDFVGGGSGQRAGRSRRAKYL